MKLLSVAVIGCAAFVPQTICQEEQKHLTARTSSAAINFTADSIERQDPPAKGPAPYASIVQLRGNVGIRTCCLQLPAGKRNPKQVVMMRADEAEYHQETGEIEVRGNVRIRFQDYPR